MSNRKIIYGVAAIIVIVVAYNWYHGYVAKKKVDELKNGQSL